MIESWTHIATSLISALLGGVMVALVNHLFTKRKMDAEVKKYHAEVDKIVAETKKIETERQNLERVSAAMTYQLTPAAEKILYDSRNRAIGHDFVGEPDRAPDAQGILVGEIASATLSFEDGILNIRRENAHGRYKVWLQRYQVDGRERDFIPKNERLAGARSFRISCEAKAMEAEHTLRFLLKDQAANEFASPEERRISSNAWTELNLYLRGSASKDYIIRVDDLGVSAAPSSVQIRNFQLAEKSA